jgi:thiosulfate/3-mercaptopyruvate sulfurtransferase
VIAPVVGQQWWREHQAQVVLADVRWYLDGRSGREAYDHGHLPGAVFVDFDQWLSRPGSPHDGRNPLPDPAVFAHGMAQLGISDTDSLLAYDDAGGVIAARLVWMLRVTGHDAALLDAGLPASAPGVSTPAPGRSTATPATGRSPPASNPPRRLPRRQQAPCPARSSARHTRSPEDPSCGTASVNFRCS